MPQHKPSAPFFAELRPSRKLQQFSLCLHGAAIAACALNALPAALRLALIGGVFASLVLTARRLKQERRKIRYSEKTGWEVDNTNKFEPVEILASSVVTPYVLFLHIRKQQPILIPRDALDDANFRQLIVKLKLTIR